MKDNRGNTITLYSIEEGDEGGICRAGDVLSLGNPKGCVCSSF